MEYSDDKTKHNGPIGVVAGDTGGDVDSVTMPKITPVIRAEKKIEREEENAEPSFAGELVCVAIKAFAVAVSLAVMLVAIIALGMPLSSMRLFNKFGMSERAVDFGERYIAGRLDDYDADVTDDAGNYTVLSRTAALSDDDFAEALYVCNNLSNKLMNGNYAAGNSAEGEYYAERLEKYTRMYMSLNNVSLVNLRTDAKNINSVPDFVKPMVYKYAHDMRVMNYRARCYLGKTDNMLFYEQSASGIVHRTQDLSQSYAGYDTQTITAQQLDEFVDFADMLGEYLDVEFLRAGIENDLSKTADVHIGDRVIKNVPIYTETYLRNYGRNLLKGNEFSMFVTSESGFTALYYQLARCFNSYAQWAVDYVPSSGADRAGDMLRQLYWLQNLAQTSQRFWYMENLLYQNMDSFGGAREAIGEEYTKHTCQNFGKIVFHNAGRLTEVYNIKIGEYIAYLSTN